LLAQGSIHWRKIKNKLVPRHHQQIARPAKHSRGAAMISQIENLAQAFYDAEGEGQSWDNEPEILKEEFRLFARNALTLLEQYHEERQQDALAAEAISFSEAA
jgi:hypothetical protein